jgi:hypothetical protein
VIYWIRVAGSDLAAANFNRVPYEATDKISYRVNIPAG